MLPSWLLCQIALELLHVRQEGRCLLQPAEGVLITELLDKLQD